MIEIVEDGPGGRAADSHARAAGRRQRRRGGVMRARASELVLFMGYFTLSVHNMDTA